MGLAGSFDTLITITDYTRRRIPAKTGLECERSVRDEIKINDVDN
jgi:hypothetical protein